MESQIYVYIWLDGGTEPCVRTYERQLDIFLLTYLQIYTL